MKKQEKIDFDELVARLLEEELKIDSEAKTMALTAKRNLGKIQCWGCGEEGHVKRDCLMGQKKKVTKFFI